MLVLECVLRTDCERVSDNVTVIEYVGSQLRLDEELLDRGLVLVVEKVCDAVTENELVVEIVRDSVEL